LSSFKRRSDSSFEVPEGILNEIIQEKEKKRRTKNKKTSIKWKQDKRKI